MRDVASTRAVSRRFEGARREGALYCLLVSITRGGTITLRVVKSILEHADAADFEFLIRVMRSPLHLRATEALYARLEHYRSDPSAANQEALAAVLEHEIRYAGSADLAFAARALSGHEAGTSADEIIHDVAKRLKVKVPAIGPIEAKLEALAEGVMAKELFKLSAEEQRELLRSQGLGPKVTNEAILRIQKHGPVAIVPLLLVVLGREAVEQLVIRLVTRAIGGLIGREAARHLIANLAARFPWWSQWVGPAVWGATGIWAVLDVQGPAYRKTIPAVLYLSLIALRTSGERKKKRKKSTKSAAPEPAAVAEAPAAEVPEAPTVAERQDPPESVGDATRSSHPPSEPSSSATEVSEPDGARKRTRASTEASDSEAPEPSEE